MHVTCILHTLPFPRGLSSELDSGCLSMGLHSATIWEVVGGVDLGGIVVRSSRDLQSAEAPERLGTGALVRELDILGDRLHYELLRGTGPGCGWVSIRSKHKVLLVKSAAWLSDGDAGSSLLPQEAVEADPSLPGLHPEAMTPGDRAEKVEPRRHEEGEEAGKEEEQEQEQEQGQEGDGQGEAEEAEEAEEEAALLSSTAPGMSGGIAEEAHVVVADAHRPGLEGDEVQAEELQSEAQHAGGEGVPSAFIAARNGHEEILHPEGESPIPRPSLRPGTAILVARHGHRLDDEFIAQGRAWVPSTERPWDPPMTNMGRRQAAALGRAVARHLSRLGLPPLSRIFTSPFLRCFETAVQVAREVGLASVCVEPSLSESFGEHFYRSWCVPNANGNWGGPDGCGIGTYVPPERVKPAARRAAGELLSLERLEHLKDSPTVLDVAYSPYVHLSEMRYRWGEFETEKQLRARMRAFFNHAAESFAGQAVLFVSHGGPLEALLTTMEPGVPASMPGYCGLYVLHRPEAGDGTWTAPVAADMDHMRPWTRPGRPSAFAPWSGNPLLGKDRGVYARLPVFGGAPLGRSKGAPKGSVASGGPGRGHGGVVPAAGPPPGAARFGLPGRGRGGPQLGLGRGGGAAALR
uniref:Uncharacterized protein n=1 Tax=Alexandrium monilatum TaxID=311494 RepID=A0A7S4SRL1_9DINO